MVDLQKIAENQFQRLITESGNDPKRLQVTYETHRTNRNALFSNQIRQTGFHEWKEDEILHQVLEAEKGLTDYIDPRNNLAYWARPPQNVRDLVSKIQQEISPLIGSGLWLVPSENLHMTTLEISSEQTADQIRKTIEAMDPKLIQELANYTIDHRARLVKPIISYDTSAIALSFVPAAGEDDRAKYSGKDDKYTYHHLRRDLYDKVTMSGVSIAARYTVPSAHITIARFVKPVGAPEGDLDSPEGTEQKAKQIFAKIEDLNLELRSTVWRRLGDPSQGEWVVGHEKGLEFMWGTTWYGKGESIMLGDGFV